MKFKSQRCFLLLTFVALYFAGNALESDCRKPKSYADKSQETSDYTVFVVDRVRVLKTAKREGLDSALHLLGYERGLSCQIGHFDKELQNNLFALVPSSPPSSNVLWFLNEYYLYPDIDKLQFKEVYLNYLTNWMKSQSTNFHMSHFLFESCLAILMDIGDTDIQEMIQLSFQNWVRLANTYRMIIKETSEEDLYYVNYNYQTICKSAFLSQYALKKLNSSFFSSEDYDYYVTQLSDDFQLPDFNLFFFPNLLLPSMDEEKRVSKRTLKSLNDLRLLKKSEVSTLFQLKQIKGCSSNVTIFVNNNAGYIFQISNCDEENCLKCHEYGTLSALKLSDKNTITLTTILSWN